MFNLFKKTCPVCGLELEKGKNCPEGWGQKFCSDGCREKYRQEIIKERQSKKSSGCCH